MQLLTVPSGALLPAVRNDFLASAVVLDETVAVLPVQVLFHRRFRALDAVMLEIRKPDDVAEHRAIRVDSRGVVLEVNSAQIASAEFITQRTCARRRYLALNHHIAASAV